MQEQDEKRFTALREMFNSEGWKIYQKEWEEVLDLMIQSAPDQCVVNDDWQYCRGAIAQIRKIVGYEQYTKMVEDQMESDDASL